MGTVTMTLSLLARRAPLGPSSRLGQLTHTEDPESTRTPLLRQMDIDVTEMRGSIEKVKNPFFVLSKECLP